MAVVAVDVGIVVGLMGVVGGVVGNAGGVVIVCRCGRVVCELLMLRVVLTQLLLGLCQFHHAANCLPIVARHKLELMSGGHVGIGCCVCSCGSAIVNMVGQSMCFMVGKLCFGVVVLVVVVAAVIVVAVVLAIVVGIVVVCVVGVAC